MVLVVTAQRVDTVGEGQERAIDVGSLNEPVPSILGRAFGAGQVDQRELGKLFVKKMSVGKTGRGEKKERASKDSHFDLGGHPRCSTLLADLDLQYRV